LASITKWDIVGNIIVIIEGGTTYVQDNDCEMKIVGNIVWIPIFLLMLNLNTLFLKEFYPVYLVEMEA